MIWLAYIGLAAGIGIFAYGLAAFIIDRAKRRHPDTGDDSRQIDIIKRGQICPWPKDF